MEPAGLWAITAAMWRRWTWTQRASGAAGAKRTRASGSNEAPRPQGTRTRFPSQMGRLRAEDFRFDEPIPQVAVPCGGGERIAAVLLWSKDSTPPAFFWPAKPPAVVPQQRQPWASRLARTAGRAAAPGGPC